MGEAPSGRHVLVLAGLTRWIDGTPSTTKLDAHIAPMADVAELTYLTAGPVPRDDDGVTYRRVHPTGHRVLDLLCLGIAAVRLGRSGRYDAIASFSLIPYGVYALLAGFVARRPVHLGIIGRDLDEHAEGPFAPIVRRAFHRFDAITIAGRSYRDRLRAMGIPAERLHIVLHPVDVTYARAERKDDPAVDLLWVGRMSAEKDPARLVAIVAALRERGHDVSAVLVGDGPMYDDVARRVDREGLSEAIDLVGWTSNPLPHYQSARLYVVTSEREMLPLTLVEAMLVGVPPVAPPIGAIPDVVADGEQGVLVPDRDPTTYADHIAALLADPDRLARMSERATAVESSLSREAVAESWDAVFAAMVDGAPATSAGSTPRVREHA